jgi:hypothetical protein
MEALVGRRAGEYALGENQPLSPEPGTFIKEVPT